MFFFLLRLALWIGPDAVIARRRSRGMWSATRSCFVWRAPNAHRMRRIANAKLLRHAVAPNPRSRRLWNAPNARWPTRRARTRSRQCRRAVPRRREQRSSVCPASSMPRSSPAHRTIGWATRFTVKDTSPSPRPSPAPAVCARVLRDARSRSTRSLHAGQSQGHALGCHEWQ